MIVRLFYWLLYHNCLNFIPDKWMISIQFRIFLNRKMNWKYPQTYNEKLNWLKYHENFLEYHRYVDKYEVRKYVAERVGEQYLVPLLGVWDSAEDIDFSLLPEKFVLKCNHGSHCSIICTEKSRLDISDVLLKMSKWMKMNWYWFYREKPYRYVRPRILAEKFMGNDNNDIPVDYKVFCSDGIPQIIRADVDRFKDSVSYNYYTLDWERSSLQFTKISDEELSRPICLTEMLDLSARLSQGFKHVRVDWYVVGDKLYFGEMTFYNAAGYDTDFIRYEDDLAFGRMLNL